MGVNISLMIIKYGSRRKLVQLLKFFFSLATSMKTSHRALSFDVFLMSWEFTALRAISPGFIPDFYFHVRRRNIRNSKFS